MNNINKLSPDKHPYTKKLLNIAKAPKSLYFIGTLPKAPQPTVAVIGARKVTNYGQEVAYKLSYELAQRNIIVMAGLAYGIDSIAHKAALDAKGTTIAVLAGGLDKIYPARHTPLAASIAERGGALLSEYEPGVPPMQYRFLERNRIVSGLADVVIVIEAAQRSGTLATVRFALEQGKEVGAVPGNITNPMSAGCNQLLRTGAAVITSVDDVLELLGMAEIPAQLQLDTPTNDAEAAIIAALQSGVRDADELQAACQLDVQTFQQSLTMLEISGRIRALGNNQWGIRR